MSQLHRVAISFVQCYKSCRISKEMVSSFSNSLILWLRCYLRILWSILLLGLILYANCTFWLSNDPDSDVTLHRTEEIHLVRLKKKLFFFIPTDWSGCAVYLLTSCLIILLRWRVVLLCRWDYITYFVSCIDSRLVSLGGKDVEWVNFWLALFILHIQSNSSIFSFFKTPFICFCILHVSSKIKLIVPQIVLTILICCFVWIQFDYAVFAYKIRPCTYSSMILLKSSSNRSCIEWLRSLDEWRSIWLSLITWSTIWLIWNWGKSHHSIINLIFCLTSLRILHVVAFLLTMRLKVSVVLVPLIGRRVLFKFQLLKANWTISPLALIVIFFNATLILTLILTPVIAEPRGLTIHRSVMILSNL